MVMATAVMLGRGWTILCVLLCSMFIFVGANGDIRITQPLDGSTVELDSPDDPDLPLVFDVTGHEMAVGGAGAEVFLNGDFVILTHGKHVDLSLPIPAPGKHTVRVELVDDTGLHKGVSSQSTFSIGWSAAAQQQIQNAQRDAQAKQAEIDKQLAEERAAKEKKDQNQGAAQKYYDVWQWHFYRSDGLQGYWPSESVKRGDAKPTDIGPKYVPDGLPPPADSPELLIIEPGPAFTLRNTGGSTDAVLVAPPIPCEVSVRHFDMSEGGDYAVLAIDGKLLSEFTEPVFEMHIEGVIPGMHVITVTLHRADGTPTGHGVQSQLLVYVGGGSFNVWGLNAFVPQVLPFGSETNTVSYERLVSWIVPNIETVISIPSVGFQDVSNSNFDFFYLPEDLPIGEHQVTITQGPSNEPVVFTKTMTVKIQQAPNRKVPKRKYIGFSPEFGRLNNHRMSFVHAYAFAHLLNRTLVIPADPMMRNTEFNYIKKAGVASWITEYDFFHKVNKKREAVYVCLERPCWATPTLHEGDGFAGSYPNLNIVDFVAVESESWGAPEDALRDLGRIEHPFIDLGVAFYRFPFEHYDDPLHLMIQGHLQFTALTRAYAAAWLRDRLGDDPKFLCFHWRREDFDGVCKSVTAGGNMGTCYQDVPYAAKAIATHAQTHGLGRVFVATNAWTSDKVALQTALSPLLPEPGIVLFYEDGSGCSSCDDVPDEYRHPPVEEQEICLQSTIAILNRYSTFSGTILAMRRALGIHIDQAF